MSKAHIFSVPNDHTLENILRFAHAIHTYQGDAEEFVFDFQILGYDTPFGMLYISNAIRGFLASRPGCSAYPVNYERHGYAAHKGYFSACGFDVGKLPGEASGSDNHISLTIIPVSQIIEEARSENRMPVEIIEKRSELLAQVLVQQKYGPLIEMLSYSIREMLRNVIEHSQSEIIVFSAQYFPKCHFAEIAILDTGLGIRETLSKNPL